MKARFILGSVVLIAHSVAGQVGPAPAAAANPPEEVSKGELRVGLSTLSVVRVSVLDGAGPSRTTGSLDGADLFARTQNIGVYARWVTGTFGSGSDGLAGGFVLQEGRLVFGEPTFSVEAGAIRRTTSAPKIETFWRGGLRSNWDIGSSGIQVTLNAGARFGKAPDGPSASMKFLGVDGEATVIFQAPRGLPIYALAGWRYERFDDEWSAVARTEEVSGPVLGLGFRLASKPFLR